MNLICSMSNTKLMRGEINMSKKTCACCKKKIEEAEAFVKHARKHNTYYCNTDCYNKAIERKKRRKEDKRKGQEGVA